MRIARAALLLALWAVYVVPTAAQEAPNAPDFPGLIAYIGADFNVYTYSGSQHTHTPLTSDAGRDDGNVRAYQWPTWSTDGRLAYFGLTVDSVQPLPSTSVFVSDDGLTAGEMVYDSETQVYNYAYWAPQNCAAEPGCRDLAVLLSDPAAGELIVERIRVNGGASSETLGSGGPFYFSWSPDATRMVWQRNNSQFDIFSIEAGEVTRSLDARPGFIAAPAWSPVDDRLLVGTLSSDGEATDLTMIGAESTETLATGLQAPVAYAWSPDGNRIAYTAQHGPIMVIDAVSGETVARAPVSGIFAFFWSPDSRSLVYVTLAVQPGSFTASRTGAMALAQGATALAWSVLDVATGANARLATFVPTQDMLYLLTYFDQFAQSHRIWSPDSRNIVYSELGLEGRPVVTVLNVAGRDSLPLTIAEGQVGVWSFD